MTDDKFHKLRILYLELDLEESKNRLNAEKYAKEDVQINHFQSMGRASGIETAKTMVQAFLEKNDQFFNREDIPTEWKTEYQKYIEAEQLVQNEILKIQISS